MLTIIFLIGLVVLFVVATVLTEIESFGWATITLVATMVAVHFIPSLDFWPWAHDHLVETMLAVLVYLVGGVVWSFIKWFSFLMQFRDKFREHKEAFLISKGIKVEGEKPTLQNPMWNRLDVPVEYRSEFKDFIRRHYFYRADKFYEMASLERPRVTKNKARIMAWMTLWPFSIVGTVLNDPMRRIFNLLFTWFKNLYQKLSDHLFRQDVELK